MSKKQWGHGYHNGVKAAQANDGTLTGLWFHSYKDGEIHWQGRITRDLGGGNYAVQLFEWLMGTPTVQKIVPFEQMKEWDFYPDDSAMRCAWEKKQ